MNACSWQRRLKCSRLLLGGDGSIFNEGKAFQNAGFSEAKFPDHILYYFVQIDTGCDA
jgi:hypothetical protein